MALRALTLPVSGGLELNTDTQHSTNSEGLEVAQARVPPPAIDIQILEPKHTSKPLPALSLAGNSSADKLGIYPCPALTLPNELVAEIFLHFLPVYPKRPPPIGPLSPYLLCHICRGWREIALTTPALWRGISFSLRNVQQLPQKLHFLNTSLALSGSYPLSIRLDSDIEGESPLRIGPFGRTIIDHCARWELLQLSIPCPWDFLPNTAESVLLPFLRELKLRKNRDFRSAGFTSNRAILVAPLLEKVTIISYHQAYDPIIPWSQLTMLYIDFIRPDQCNILNQLVNLISCRLRMYRIRARYLCMLWTHLLSRLCKGCTMENSCRVQSLILLQRLRH
ncbi:hypothetical protein K438DRAFT_1802378 [Mycena galopus ATCC 62051]|nr:hypothetical protein K438DRAFT_1802378 [Mycena galopus ATCC 62051]